MMDSLGLDDLHTSVRALTRLGELAIEARCYDETVMQIPQFSARTFNPDRGLNLNGWIVATKVNEPGQVEGTCVGTGMGFDQAFCHNQPQSSRAAQGYRPVLLAGAEMITLTKVYR